MGILYGGIFLATARSLAPSRHIDISFGIYGYGIADIISISRSIVSGYPNFFSFWIIFYGGIVKPPVNTNTESSYINIAFGI